CHVLLGDMNQPLAPAAGNALEVRVALDHLASREVPARFHEMTLALGAELLTMSGLAKGRDEARDRLRATLDSGAALERFARMVAAQGGPADFCERPGAHLPSAPVTRPVPAPRDGVVARMDTVALGRAAHSLGAGRSDHGHAVDPRVGLAGFVSLGQRVTRGEPLATVHAASESAAERAAGQVAAAIMLADESPPLPPLVHRRITPNPSLTKETSA
ncbi:MAG: thymidine phosphorylase, partial [Xanthomonadales bacterium]|nr:thymidine phosphorylase [Xanthomonadales bacterium]